MSLAVMDPRRSNTSIINWMRHPAFIASFPDDCRPLFQAAHDVRFSANAFAAIHGYSLRQMERRLSRHVAQGPKRFLAALRATAAVYALYEGASVKEVASDLGYCDHAHLTREVVTHSGVRPSSIVDKIKGDMHPSVMTSQRFIETVAFIQKTALALVTIINHRVVKSTATRPTIEADLRQ